MQRFWPKRNLDRGWNIEMIFGEIILIGGWKGETPNAF